MSTGRKVGVSGLVKNPVYLGQARSGSIVKEGAHEPLVTRAEFEAAQSVTKSLLTPREGSLAEKAMLAGLARCAGCGHTLEITGNSDKKRGERYPIYDHTGRYATGPCPSRANVRASLLDAYVERQVSLALNYEDGLLARTSMLQRPSTRRCGVLLKPSTSSTCSSPIPS